MDASMRPRSLPLIDNVTNSPLVEQDIPHKLDYLLEVRSKPWGAVMQYFINPSLSWNDVPTFLTSFFIVLIIRAILSGVYDKRARKYGSVFQYLFSNYIQPEKKHKFSENLWYACWHMTSFTWCLCVLYSEAVAPLDRDGWTRRVFSNWDTSWYLIPTPGEYNSGNPGWPLFPVSAAVRRLYLTELSFWSACLAYIGIETKRDDFKIMVVHHIVTIILIVLSYTCSYWRFGLFVLATHDIGDIFLYVSKTLHYSTCRPFFVDAGFSLFIIAFFVSRLVFFPLFCVRPTFSTTYWFKWTKGIVKSHWDVPGGVALPASLCLLQILHIFWSGLILRMLVRTIKAKTVTDCGDIRSEIDSEDYNELIADDEYEERDTADSTSDLSEIDPNTKKNQ